MRTLVIGLVLLAAGTCLSPVRAQDSTSPRVVSLSPGSTVTSQAGLSEIRIGFDEPVSVPAQAVTVHTLLSSHRHQVSSTFEPATNELVVTLSSPVTSFGSPAGPITLDLVTVVLDFSIVDLAGNPLDGEFFDPRHPVLPSGNGLPGGPAVFQIVVLTGDVVPDGVVNSQDLAALRDLSGFCVGDPEFDPRGDLNEDGCIDNVDRAIAFGAVGLSVPLVSMGPEFVASPSRFLTEALSTLEVEFSEPMARELFRSRTLFLISESGAILVPSSAALDLGQQSATYEFDPPLDPCANYLANLSNGLLGVSGAPLEIADEPFLLSGLIPPSPQLDPHITLTDTSPVTITGTALGATMVTVVAPSGTQQIDLMGQDTFSVDVPLVENAVNAIFFSASSACAGSESAPVSTAVTYDLQPPALSIQFPVDGSDFTTDAVLVSGLVGDALSGFMGLEVTVNGATTIVDIGIGTNGTFISTTPIPLALGANDLIAMATDALGNESTSQVTVTRIDIPVGTPTLEVASGDAQEGMVGEVLSAPVVILALDGNGEALVGQDVTFQVTESDGLLSDGAGGPESQTYSATTDARGLAEAFWRLGTDAGCGNNRIEVTASGVTGTVFFFASGNAAPPSQINVGMGNQQRVEVSNPAPDPLRIFVSDGNNPAAGVPVTFTALSAGGLVDGQSVVTVPTGPTGHAQVEYTLSPAVGLQRVQANFDSNPGLPATFFIDGIARNVNQPTVFVGRVLDNASRPVGGAEVELEIGGQISPTVFTDGEGRFTIESISPGPGHLYVNGLVADTLDGLPIDPGSFPALAYVVLVIENAVNRLATPVLLPALDPVNARSYSTTTDTVLEVAGVMGLEMTIPAGSMTLSNGQPAPDGTVVALNQVHFDEVPMPMPDGAAPPFAWTLQPAGAHFDPPISISLPNMPGLAPGAACYFLSFDHDVNMFLIVAQGHATADGASLVTDPGQGITKAGWGGFCPPYPPLAAVQDIASLQSDFVLAGGGNGPNGGGGGGATPGFQVLNPITGILGLEAPGTPGGLTTTTGAATDAYVDGGGTPDPDPTHLQGSPEFGATRGDGTFVHLGVDLLAPVGTPVQAVADGFVELARFDEDSFGNFIVVFHTTETVPFRSYYGHLSERLVVEGDLVLAGDPIGLSGVTGNACDDSGVYCVPQPHLDFKIIGPAFTPFAKSFDNCMDPVLLLTGALGPIPAAPTSPLLGEPSDPVVFSIFSMLGAGTSDFTDGSYLLANVPFTAGLQRVRGTVQAGSFAISFATPQVTLIESGTVSVDQTQTEYDAQPPISITAVVDTTILTPSTPQAQITVTALLVGGMLMDVTASAAGTTYQSSNPTIVGVDTEGLLTAQGPGGSAFVTVTHEGITAVVAVSSTSGMGNTTVEGIVQSSGTPFQGAVVTVLPGGATTLSALDGSFSIPNVASDLGDLSIEVTASSGGMELFGTVTGVTPVPGAVTDVGIVAIAEAVFWAVDSSGSWHEGANWSTGSVPTAGDLVLIDRPAGDFTITVSEGTQAGAGLLCTEALVITGGSLAISGELLAENDLTVIGGSLEDATLQVNGQFSISGGTLGNLTVIPGPAAPPIIVNGFSSSLEGITLSTVLILQTGSAVAVSNGLVIDGGSLQLGFGSPFQGSETNVNLQGDQTVTGLNGGEIVFAATNLTGQLRTNGGTTTFDAGLTIRSLPGAPGRITNGTWTSLGTIEAQATSSLTLGGNWSNQGLLTATDCTLLFQGSFSTADIGTFVRSGGTVQLSGSLDNTGDALAFDATTGSWQFLFGTVTGGIIQAADGESLVPAFSFGTRVLDNVTLMGAFSVPDNTNLDVTGGLTLDGASLTLASDGALTELLFDGTQTVSGIGVAEIILGGTSDQNLVSLDGGLTTFDAGVTIRGGAGQVFDFNGDALVQGTIRAETAGATLSVLSDWESTGAIEALNGSTLELGGNWTSSGLHVVTDSALEFRGDYSLPGATFQRTGGSITLIGNLDNSGSTLTLDATTGSWDSAGRIFGGSVETLDGTQIVAIFVDDEQARLDSVTLLGEVVVADGADLAVTGGVNLNGGSITLASDGQLTRVIGQGQTIVGSNGGEIVFAGTSDQNLLQFSGATVVEAGVTIRGGAGSIGGPTNSLTLGGTIRAETTGQTITIDGTWSSSGALEALSGATLAVTGTGSSTGLVLIDSLSTLTTVEAYQQDGGQTLANGILSAPMGVTVTAGDFAGLGTVTGDLANSGSVTPGDATGALTLDGAYTQAAVGTFVVELGGPNPGEFDALSVASTAALDGTIDVALTGGFTPVLGQTFLVLSSTGLTSGTFATELGLDIGGGLLLQVNYLANGVELEVISGP